ncbi:MAG: YeeE/YedE family protein [Chitinivibrionales bacterium]|nr:YeeE/YedE family protein [Chitinivibrionales bacterium]
MNWIHEPLWSAYIVGAGIGVLSWISFLLLDKPIGCSSAFSRSAAMILALFRGRNRIETHAYYKKFPPSIDWEWMLVAGIVLGSALSSLLSASFEWRFVSAVWKENFGDSAVLKTAIAFIGGIIMGFGARWAGGCTSGHGISGTMQLALSSWIAAICFFIGGILTAHLIYWIF